MIGILLDVIAPVTSSPSSAWMWGLAKTAVRHLSFSMVATYVGTPCLIVDSLSASGLKLRP